MCTIDFEEVTKEKVATVTANFLTHPEWDPVSAGMYEFMVFSWIMHPTTLLGALSKRDTNSWASSTMYIKISTVL